MSRKPFACLSFDPEEMRTLRYVSTRYTTGERLYRKIVSAEQGAGRACYSRRDVESVWRAGKLDGGDRGQVPLVGGPLANKIISLFQRAGLPPSPYFGGKR